MTAHFFHSYLGQLRCYYLFFSSLKARNLWRKSLRKYGLWPEINHRIIGIYTECFLVASQEIFGGNL